jgi:hypothetical protein
MDQRQQARQDLIKRQKAAKEKRQKRTTESFLKDLDDNKNVRYMSKEQFSKFLRSKGFSYPVHAKKGSRYLNVFGSAERVKTKQPFALVVYEPRNQMREEYYSDPKEALGNAPERGLWQVLNLWTMEIIYDPFNTGNRGVDLK